MIIKLKYLFLLAVCAAGLMYSALTAAAQTNGGDKVLVVGNKSLRQSDVNGLIAFYEWAFEAKFTAAQREKFQQLVTQAFRQDPDASRSNADFLIDGLKKMKALDESTQQQKREIFNSSFVADLRKAQADDETAQLLLNVYDGARGGKNNNSLSAGNESNENTEETSVVTNDDDSTSAGVGNISSLVGKWVWGRTGSSVYAQGGGYLGGNGSRHTYQFFANGTVEYTGIMNVMTGGCNMQIFRTTRGKVRISGDSMTINWAPASFSRDDSCSPSKNYKKTMPAETETLQVKFKDSYGQKQLCLTGKDETCFSPANN